MKEKIEEALESIRPSLMADGGNVELIDVTEDGTVKVRMTGACGSCPMSQMTLSQGIETAIRSKVPEVKEIISV